LLDIARRSISSYFSGESFEIPEVSNQFKEPRGVFVTLWSPGKELRGCIGHVEPVKLNLAEEIRECAVAAAVNDPRFPPLELSELSDLKIEISLLEPFQKIDKLSELDPRKYGVMVHSGVKRGLLLPDIDGVETVAKQVSIAMQKGGISSNDQMDIFRFEVLKISE